MEEFVLCMSVRICTRTYAFFVSLTRTPTQAEDALEDWRVIIASAPEDLQVGAQERIDAIEQQLSGAA